MPTLVVNHNGFDRMRRKFGIEDDAELGRRMKVDKGTMSRVMSGKNAPSAKFIAGALRTFGDAWFAELFDVVDESVSQRNSTRVDANSTEVVA